jgi:8-oxo-dGTP pyrophosphatase MutT (NUDIX family)
MELPDDLPVEHRRAVRLVVLDSADHVLLFRTRHPEFPEFGTWWELPGGGIDPDETFVDTAIRELFEETGLRVDPAQIGPPTWKRCATYRQQGMRRVQDEVVMTVRLPDELPAVDVGGQTEYELVSYLSTHWWPLEDLLATNERCYPGRLPELLPALLAGEPVDEPFEVWS